MPIPELDGDTGALPIGDHATTLEEIEQRFAYNHRRREILEGLKHALGLLAQKGVGVVWVDGSFVTSVERPRDVDVVYRAPEGADVDTWDWLSPARRKDLKKYHRVDLWKFPSSQRDPQQPNRKISIKEFFEKDRDGNEKGLLRLNLNGSE